VHFSDHCSDAVYCILVQEEEERLFVREDKYDTYNTNREYNQETGSQKRQTSKKRKLNK